MLPQMTDCIGQLLHTGVFNNYDESGAGSTVTR